MIPINFFRSLLLLPVVTAVFLMLYGPTAGAVDDNQHLCKADDMHGPYIMMNLTETPEGKEASWYHQLPYHYLTFYPPKHYVSTALDHPVEKLADLNALLKENAKPELEYTIGNEGILELKSDKGIEYSYRCYAVTDNSDSNQKGDLLFSGHGKGNSSNIYKLYRPVTKDMDVH